MTIEIEIEDEAWFRAAPDVEGVVARATQAALEVDPDRLGSDVVILLSDDATVRDLNSRFRDRDRPTNVLSFPSAPQPGLEGSPAHRPVLGDIVLAYGVCAAEAEEQGKTLTNHLAHLVVHGTLHLLGHDHELESDAERMEAQERSILAGLGISDPYEIPHDA